MTAPNMELLMSHFIADISSISDIVDDQIELLAKGKNKKAIVLGDHWVVHYMHVPHAMVFDMWSARAESALNNEKHVLLRILRADCIFRRWERSVKDARYDLTGGEKHLIQFLMMDVAETLEWLCDVGENKGCFRHLFRE